MDLKKIIVNSQRLSEVFSYEDFKANDTIIIESGTGTGKSFTFAKYVKQLLEENENLKLLSIFGKTNLGKQQQKYFEEAGIKTNFYKDNNFKFEGNVLICINSLIKYVDLLRETKQEYIIFIDEVSIFTTEITHNETIEKLAIIYCLLKNLILKANKVYVCQNSINDSALCLIEKRVNVEKIVNIKMPTEARTKLQKLEDKEINLLKKIKKDPKYEKDYKNNCLEISRLKAIFQEKEKTKTIFIKNEFKKNNGTQAIYFESYEMLLETMKNEAKSKPFLFACDSKAIVDKVYEVLSKQKPLFEIVKFTSKTEKISTDFDFKNKIVLYSPSITTGIDCSLNEIQCQFIHIVGNIEGGLLYQMAMRTRNIDKLYLSFDSKVTKKDCKYNSLEDCQQYLELNIENGLTQLIKMCVYIDENDNLKTSINNSFFQLFYRNEYLKEKSMCDLKSSFIQILELNGFEIQKCKINIESEDVKHEMKLAKEKLKEISEEEFKNYLDGKSEDENLDNLINNILHLENEEQIIKYKDVLMDEYKLKSHFNCVRIFNKFDHLVTSLEKYKDNSFIIKITESTIYKIMMLKKLMNNYNINIFDLNNNYNDKIEISAEDKKTVKEFDYRVKLEKFNTKYELIKFIVSKLNNLCKNIISSKQNAKKKYEYKLNDEILKYNFELYCLRSKCCSIEPKLVEHLGIKIEESEKILELFE